MSPILIGSIAFGAFLAALIYLSFCDAKSGIVMTPEELALLERERASREPEITSLHATVIDMSCEAVTIGYHLYTQPRTERYFVIVFESDDGEILEIPVVEEMYDGFDVGLSGVLTLSDGQISSFVPDDECESAQENN